MVLRPFLYEATACASYLFGCLTHRSLAVVDPHAELVESYLEESRRLGAPIAAVFETHVQADHVSGLPALVAAGATAYLPAGASVDFEHVPLGDGEVVELGNTLVRALATPGHAPAHHAYLVADRRRGTEEPWLVFTGDSLLVGDVGRPDLHADGQPERLARDLFRSISRLLVLGWALALPVPLLVAFATSWWMVVAANVLLGLNQGFAWSMTVVMKIDLAGPRRRGLALGLNEAAGYLGLAAAAFASGVLAASFAPRTVVWAGAAVLTAVGLLVSIVAVR